MQVSNVRMEFRVVEQLVGTLHSLVQCHSSSLGGWEVFWCLLYSQTAQLWAEGKPVLWGRMTVQFLRVIIFNVLTP